MLLFLKIRLKKCILFVKYILICIKAITKSDVQGEKVLLDVTGLRINRRIVQVALQLINAGYMPYYKMPAKLYVETVYNGWDDYQQFFFENVRMHQPKNDYLVVFCGENNECKYEKKIVFFDHIASFMSEYNRTFYYPILFHPVYLSNNTEEQIIGFEKENRLGILFIGSNATTYDLNKDDIHKTYKIETRYEVISYLLDNFKDSIVRPDNKEQLFSLLFDDRMPLKNKIVIIDKFRINGEDYWTVLKSSAFHLWTCGYSQPYCHNQVEGMCCGAIPILNKNIIYPGLNNSNSFQYSDLEELGRIVESILCNDIFSKKVYLMNKNVLSVYINHLSNEAFREKIDMFIHSSENEKTYYICEHIY